MEALAKLKALLVPGVTFVAAFPSRGEESRTVVSCSYHQVKLSMPNGNVTFLHWQDVDYVKETPVGFEIRDNLGIYNVYRFSKAESGLEEKGFGLNPSGLDRGMDSMLEQSNLAMMTPEEQLQKLFEPLKLENETLTFQAEEDGSHMIHQGKVYFKLLKDLHPPLVREHELWLAREAVSLLVGLDPRIQMGLEALEKGERVHPLNDVFTNLTTLEKYYGPYKGEAGSLEDLAGRRLIAQICRLLIGALANLDKDNRCCIVVSLNRALMYNDIASHGTLHPATKALGWNKALEDLMMRIRSEPYRG